MTAHEFLIPFVALLLAELGDKTQLAILLIASRIHQPISFFLGVMAGFLLVDGLAILFGSWISNLIPASAIQILSGVLFTGFGVWMLLKKDAGEEDSKPLSKQPWIIGFFLIAAAEWGDKTQIAAGLFGAQYALLPVLAGTMAALGLLSFISIYAGKWLSRHIQPQLIHRIAALVFIVIGLSSFLFLLR